MPCGVEVEEEATENESEEGDTDEQVGWQKSKAGCERVRLVMEEMEWMETQNGKVTESVDWGKADDAESVKHGLRCAYRDEQALWRDLKPPMSVCWQRVSLQRLRFKQKKKWYFIVRTWDRKHRLLVLVVPPKNV